MSMPQNEKQAKTMEELLNKKRPRAVNFNFLASAVPFLINHHFPRGLVGTMFQTNCATIFHIRQQPYLGVE
jgi:hypothetical protein